MKLSPAFLLIALIGAVVTALYLGISRWVDNSRSNQRELSLRQDKKLDSLLLLTRAQTAETNRANLEASQAEAARRAAQDATDRSARDNETMLLIAAMTKPQQNDQALQYLIANGFLSRPQYENSKTEVSADSNVTRAVATQGRVLSDTRAELARSDTVRRGQEGKISALEVELNRNSHAITDVRAYALDRVAERGLFRARSKRQFREVDRRLGEIQRQTR